MNKTEALRFVLGHAAGPTEHSPAFTQEGLTRYMDSIDAAALRSALAVAEARGFVRQVKRGPSANDSLYYLTGAGYRYQCALYEIGDDHERDGAASEQ